jgi:predicted transcriptional regulator
MSKKKEKAESVTNNVKKIEINEFINLIGQSKLTLYETKEQFEAAIKAYNDNVLILVQIVKKNEEEIKRLNMWTEKLKAKK